MKCEKEVKNKAFNVIWNDNQNKSGLNLVDAKTTPAYFIGPSSIGQPK